MNTCRYCGYGPLRNKSYVRCSAPECARAWKRDYMREYQRDWAAKHGAWWNAGRRPRKSNSCCVDCGAPVGHGRTQETRCRKCHEPLRAQRVRERWAAGAPARQQAARRRAAQRRLDAAARGVSRGWVFVSGRCASCGAEFTCQVTHTPGRYCSKTCARREARALRRAREAGVKITPGRRHAVFERDNWTCRICGDPVNREAKAPELDAPVVDHRTPLARGGAHGPENWQTAHFYCNSIKRDQVGFDFAGEVTAA